MISDLALGNKAVKEKRYAQALRYFKAALANRSELASIIKGNIQLVERKLGPPFQRASADHSNTEEVVSIDIVVPVYNALEDVKLCLQSLAKHTDGFQVRVLVVNDASDESTSAWLREYCAGKDSFYLIEHPFNKGYTCAVNSGLRASTADFVITQNSDTIVAEGWLQSMVRCMKSHPKIGVVGPLSNAASWQNVPTLLDESGSFAVNELPEGQTINTMAQLVASVSAKYYPRLPFVNGFCFMIRREVIDIVGYLDEENFPVGYGEENDYCIRVSDAGYELAIADDAYVFHAKSKSFGHERRKLLSQEGTRSIKRKHTLEKYDQLLALVKKTEKLDWVRERISLELARLQNPNNIDLMSMRILFLLPVKGGGGGAHSVVQEVSEMRRLGLHARVGVKYNDLEGFVNSYADIEGSADTFVGFDDASLLEVAEIYDVVVGTIFTSMQLVKRIVDINPHILPAYYVQDYEPMFFTEGSSNWQEARDSYTLVKGAFLFAKTQWIIEQVQLNHGLAVHKVQPSIDHQVYKPALRGCNGRLNITAMIRPQTPRRGAGRTMHLLSRLNKKHGERISIHLFGCDSDTSDFKMLKKSFPFTNHGQLFRPQVAELLAQSDLFIDLSDYQAFGRTSLEAMACGCASVVPTAGGGNEYAIHEHNALVLDTLDEDACYQSVTRLLEQPEVLQHMRRNGLLTAARYSVHGAAISEAIPLEAALKSWRIREPRLEKKVLYVMPSLRPDGQPTDSGYIRTILPYKSKSVLRYWKVHQTSTLPQPGTGQAVLIQNKANDLKIEELQRWLPAWKAAGGKLLYDIDDDLLDFNQDKVRFLAKHANLVHVPTEHMARCTRSFNSAVKVLPTKLDAGLWGIFNEREHDESFFCRSPNGPVRIGYIGIPTQDEDIDLVADAMLAIKKKYGLKVEIEIIGGFQDRKPSFGKRVGLPKKNDYPNYVRWLHERVNWDIGIIPFLHKNFDETKLNLKLFEYAALDMAIVVSDHPGIACIENLKKYALIAKNSKESWIENLIKLIDNPDLRKARASIAREAIICSYNSEKVDEMVINSLKLI